MQISIEGWGSPDVYQLKAERKVHAAILGPGYRSGTFSLHREPRPLIGNERFATLINGSSGSLSGDSLQVQSAPDHEHTSNRYSYAHNPYEKRSIEHPLGPIGHLLLGIQIRAMAGSG
jgi:hypothetical protein